MTFGAKFLKGQGDGVTGVLTDPFSITSVKIYPAGGSVSVATLSPINVATGHRQVTWTPTDAGAFEDEWIWTGANGQTTFAQRYNLSVRAGTTVSGPLVWSNLRNAIRDWLVLTLGLTTIWEEEEAPRPAYPYASLRILSGSVKIHSDVDEQTLSGNDIIFTTIGNREFAVSVQAFASFEGAVYNPDADGMHYATAAQGSLETPSVLETFRAAGLSVADVLAITNRNTALDATWLSRAGFDIRFRAVSSIVSAPVPSVATIVVSSDLSGQQAGSDIDLTGVIMPVD